MHQKIAASTPSAILLTFLSCFTFTVNSHTYFPSPSSHLRLHFIILLRLSPHNLTVITEPDLQLRAYKHADVTKMNYWRQMRLHAGTAAHKFSKLMDYKCGKMSHIEITKKGIYQDRILMLQSYFMLKRSSIGDGKNVEKRHWLGQHYKQNPVLIPLATGWLGHIICTNFVTRMCPVPVGSLCWVELIVSFVLPTRIVFWTPVHTMLAMDLFD